MKTAMLVVALAAGLGLTACGGGGDGNSSSQTTPTQNPPAQASPVQTNSQATASAIGATNLSTSSNKEVFDLAADIGDTWRLTVDTATGNYQVVPNNSQYGIATESGTLTRTVLGNFVNYSLAGKISLYQDLQTKTISGTMTIGGKSASVAGSPYQVGDMAALAGTYDFLGTTRDPSGAVATKFLGGQLLINSDGATGLYCVAGNVFVQAGDRGPVLVVDHYTTAAPITLGNLYAVKAQTLQGNEFDGSWLCSYFGQLVGTLKNSGTTINVTQGASAWQETLSLNKVNGASALYDFNGFAVSAQNGTDPVSNGVMVLPLSSSLAVFENDGKHAIDVCTRSN